MFLNLFAWTALLAPIFWPLALMARRRRDMPPFRGFLAGAGLWAGAVLARSPFLGFDLEPDEFAAISYAIQPDWLTAINAQLTEIGGDLGTNPPLHRMLLWLLIGPDGGGLREMRLWWIALAALGVLPLYALGRRIGGETGGLTLAALFALSPLACVNAPLLRGYGLLLVTISWFLASWWQCVEERRLTPGTMLSAHLSCWVHYSALPLVAGCLVVAGAAIGRRPRRSEMAGTGVLLLGLSYLAWTAARSPAKRELWKLGASGTLLDWRMLDVFTMPGTGMFLAVIAFVGAAGLIGRIRTEQWPLAILPLAGLASLALPIAVAMAFGLRIRTRYLLFLLPLELVCVLWAARGRYARGVMAIAVAAAALGYGLTLREYQSARFDRWDRTHLGFDAMVAARILVTRHPVTVLIFDHLYRYPMLFWPTVPYGSLHDGKAALFPWGEAAEARSMASDLLTQRRRTNAILAVENRFYPAPGTPGADWDLVDGGPERGGRIWQEK